jgi:cytochrome P450
MAINGSDPDYLQGTVAETLSGGFKKLFDYTNQPAPERRGCPMGDPLSLIAIAQIIRCSLSASEVAHDSVQIMLAGFETTHNAIPGGVLGLLQHA